MRFFLDNSFFNKFDQKDIYRLASLSFLIEIYNSFFLRKQSRYNHITHLLIFFQFVKYLWYVHSLLNIQTSFIPYATFFFQIFLFINFVYTLNIIESFDVSFSSLISIIESFNVSFSLLISNKCVLLRQSFSMSFFRDSRASLIVVLYPFNACMTYVH